MKPANAAAAAPPENPISVHTPTDIGLCGLNTRSMLRNRCGPPQIRDQQRGGDDSAGRRDPAGVAHQFAVRPGVVGDRAHHGRRARRAADEKVQRNLPGPGGLLEQRNPVVAGLGEAIGKAAPAGRMPAPITLPGRSSASRRAISDRRRCSVVDGSGKTGLSSCFTTSIQQECQQLPANKSPRPPAADCPALLQIDRRHLRIRRQVVTARIAAHE